jgi:hypothetical protein
MQPPWVNEEEDAGAKKAPRCSELNLKTPREMRGSRRWLLGLNRIVPVYRAGIGTFAAFTRLAGGHRARTLLALS